MRLGGESPKRLSGGSNKQGRRTLAWPCVDFLGRASELTARDRRDETRHARGGRE